MIHNLISPGTQVHGDSGWWIDGLMDEGLRGIRSRLALKVEGLARVSKNAGGRPRLASVVRGV